MKRILLSSPSFITLPYTLILSIQFLIDKIDKIENLTNIPMLLPLSFIIYYPTFLFSIIMMFPLLFINVEKPLHNVYKGFIDLNMWNKSNLLTTLNKQPKENVYLLGRKIL